MTPSNGRILVVDDDRTNRMMLTYRLEVTGLKTGTAENGQIALEKLRQDHYDLVLLDILMPDLDGYATLQMIKQDPELRETPIIMMSALGEMDSVVRCLEMGAEDYLPKPLDSLLLASRVNGILLRGQLEQLESDHATTIGRLADAAAAAARGDLESGSLDDLARQADQTGRLAQEIQHLAATVASA